MFNITINSNDIIYNFSLPNPMVIFTNNKICVFETPFKHTDIILDNSATISINSINPNLKGNEKND